MLCCASACASRSSGPQVRLIVPRRSCFIAPSLRRGFTPPLRRSLRLRGLLMPCTLGRLVSSLSFSFGPSSGNPTTTTSADFSLRASPSPFQARGEISPGKNAILRRTIAPFTLPCFGHKSFAVSCPLALLGSASYEVRVPRLAVSLPASSPRSVALAQLRFASLAVASSREDLHLQDRAHAGRTTKRGRRPLAISARARPSNGSNCCRRSGDPGFVHPPATAQSRGSV
ncbi:hypothetical protein VPARA_26700 [Variovorax paradoxus]|uniref:Uncharacterized protein n=1 Tax=Variovorax paradoxus TaxID=34073 RepID=A0A0H2M0P5_VARPD|nr:hypothetical protein VPARA_26700 [Variovorax paradoxus]